MNTTLPTTVTISDREYAIRYDFRAILDILTMLNDPDFTSGEKGLLLLNIFYETPEEITDYEAAIHACFNFIDAGNEKKERSPRVMDWEQDFPYIVAPVNRVLGREIREDTPLHWWTFVSAYMEIGPECLFSQLVSIRDKRARGKKLEKAEKEWLNRNRSIVNLKQHFSEAENALISQWMGGEING